MDVNYLKRKTFFDDDSEELEKFEKEKRDKPMTLIEQQLEQRLSAMRLKKVKEEKKEKREQREQRELENVMEESKQFYLKKEEREERIRQLLLTPAAKRIEQMYITKKCQTKNCPEPLTREELSKIPINWILEIDGCCYDSRKLYNKWKSPDDWVNPKSNKSGDLSDSDKLNIKLMFMLLEKSCQILGNTLKIQMKTSPFILNNTIKLSQGLYNLIQNYTPGHQNEIQPDKRKIFKVTNVKTGTAKSFFGVPVIDNQLKGLSVQVSEQDGIHLGVKESVFYPNTDINVLFNICILPIFDKIVLRLTKSYEGDPSDIRIKITNAINKKQILETGETIDINVDGNIISYIIDKLYTGKDLGKEYPVSIAITKAYGNYDIDLEIQVEESELTPHDWLLTKSGQEFIDFMEEYTANKYSRSKVIFTPQETQEACEARETREFGDSESLELSFSDSDDNTDSDDNSDSDENGDFSYDNDDALFFGKD